MIRLRHKLFVRAMRVLDPLLLFATLSFVMALAEHRAVAGPLVWILEQTYTTRDVAGIVVLAVGWLSIFSLLVHYDADRLAPLRSELTEAALAATGSAFLLLVVGTAFSFSRVTATVIVVVWSCSTALVLLARVGVRAFLTVVRRSGYNYRLLLVVGYNARARATADRIERAAELGYKIVGFLAEDPHAAADPTQGAGARHRILGGLKDLQRVLERHAADEIIICLRLREHLDAVFDLVRLAQELGIVARVLPDATDNTFLPRLHLERFDGEYVVTLFRQQSLVQLAGKRLLDVLGASIVLLVSSPLLLAAAVAIKLTSPGPVLFVQRRVGMNRRTFNLYKFRSMYVDAEQRRRELAHLNEMDGPVFKIANDPRITRVGRFIRKTSIDELPQLFNVLSGRMSLVGPRPPLPEEVEQYEWLYRKRLSIKPGITCLWQVKGRNRISFKQWMELDREYIENWSLWLDLKILVATIPAVLLVRGAS